MKISELTIKNYRSYENAKIKFSDGLNVLIGKNAQGKTNLLEAIFFTVIGKSFKTSKEKEVIAWGEGNSYVKAVFSKKYRDEVIELIFNSQTKKVIKEIGRAHV